MVPSASIMKCAESPQPFPLGRGRLCIDLKQERELTQPSKCRTSCETPALQLLQASVLDARPDAVALGFAVAAAAGLIDAAGLVGVESLRIPPEHHGPPDLESLARDDDRLAPPGRCSSAVATLPHHDRPNQGGGDVPSWRDHRKSGMAGAFDRQKR